MRPYKKNIELEVKTKYGSVELCVTDANHVYVSDAGLVCFVVRGAHLRVGIHFYLEDGKWVNGPGRTAISRLDRSLAPSEAMRRDAINACREAIEKAVTPQILAQAQANHLNNEIRGIQEKMAKTEQELHLQQEKLVELLREEAGIDMTIPQEKPSTDYWAYLPSRA